MKKVSAKLLSVFAAVLVAATSICSAALYGVFARANTANWFIPCNAYSLISAATRTSWGWDSALTIEEIADDGGLQFVWKDAAVARRQGFAKSFDLDGLTLRFSGLQNTAGKGGFAILLQDSTVNNLDPVNPEAGVLALIAVDLEDGEIRYENDGIGLNANGAKRYLADGTVLLKNDALKYAALQDKEFTIGFSANTNGGFDVALTVGGTTLTGTQSLTKEMLQDVTQMQNTATTFVGLAPGRDNSGTTSLKFTGICNIHDTTGGSTEGDALWYAPTAAAGVIPAGDLTSWWSGNLTVNYLPSGGGVHWNCQHNGVGMRQGWKQSFPLDGLTLRFNNLKNDNKKASLLLYLTDDFSGGLDPNANGCMAHMLLALDTVKGQLRFENDGATNEGGKIRIRQAGTVLLENDLLKYDALAGKEFTVGLTAGTEGNYSVTVTVGEQSVVGTDVLTAAMLSRIVRMNALDRVYVGLGNNNGNEGWTTVDITGIGPIRKVAIAKTELKKANIAGENYWPAMLSCEESPTGGLRYSFTGAFRNIRLGVQPAASLDGMYLKLNNFAQTGSLKPRLGLVFSKTADDEVRDGMFCLVLDTENGTLRVVRSRQLTGADGTEDVIIASDTLKYAAIAGRVVVLRSYRQTDGSWKFTLRVGNEPLLTGTLTAEQMAKSNYAKFDPNASLYLTVTPGVPQNANLNQNFTVDVVEYWSSTVNPDRVAQAIDAIGTVSLEHGAPVRLAREMYEQLPLEDRATVANYAALEAAETRYAELANAADAALIPMSKANARVHSSTDPSVIAALEAWAPRFSALDLEPRGMRFLFTGASRNMRDGYAGHASLDGLLLQFDNLSAGASDTAKLAIMIGNGNSFGVEYSEARQAIPLTLVLDPAAGTLTVQPCGRAVFTSDALKLENLKGNRFSLLFSANRNNGYDLTLNLCGRELRSTIVEDDVMAAVSLTNAESVDVTLTPWESNSTFSVDFVGLRQTKLTADEVMALIDSVGLVTLDSGDRIQAALDAYHELSEKAQVRVDNYDTLVKLNNYYLGLDFDAMIADTEALIDEIGTVGYKSAAAIRAATIAYERLNEAQRARLSNYGKLTAAVAQFYQLTKDKMVYESYANSINPTVTAGAPYGDWWVNTKFTMLENKALRIEWDRAIRDVRNGPSLKQQLDGLFMRFANLTAEEGSNGAGTKLSIQLGTRGTNYRGGVNLTAMALVLDTYEGALYGYPGGRLILQDEMLKQANLNGKEFSVRFDMTEEGLYRVVIAVEGKEVAGIVPTSMIDNSTIELNVDDVGVAVSPWVNTADGTTDNSIHKFSVDILSVQSSGAYAFEDLYDLMERIDRLPASLTESDRDTVWELADVYRGLPRTLRQYVTNYTKLSAAINGIYEDTAEDYSEWDNSAPERVGPATGDRTRMAVYGTVAVAIAAAGVLVLTGVLRRKRRSLDN